MISKKTIKLCFLTASVCLAGLSISDVRIKAGEDSIEGRLFKRIEYAVEHGNIKDCKADIKRVLKLNPRHPGATFFAGKYALEAKDFANAEKFLRRVENDLKYGAQARKLQAEIRAEKFRRKYMDTLGVALKGEAFGKALQICEGILEETPKSPEVLFLAGYAAAMQGYREKAEDYAKRFSMHTTKAEAKAELKAFIDAIFSIGYAPELALEKLISITDRRLITPPVRRKIKDLIVSLHQVEIFEKFIDQEKNIPGSSVNELERELIEFLIEQKQYEKALAKVNLRPANQIEDNILLIRLLVLTGQEEKAMLTTRQLLSANPKELRLYESWTEAWLGYVDRTSRTPDGQDETGKSFDEMAQEVLDRLKMDKLVTMRPSLLLRLLRLAVLTNNENKVKEIRSFAVKISFTESISELLLKTVDGLVTINRSSVAADLLESARNQLHGNHSLSLKLAEIYFINNNPETAAKILEEILQEKPEMIRAFMLWVDCQSVLGESQKAEKAILTRLAEPEIHDLVQRQLENKLEVVRMQVMVQEEPEDMYAPESGEETEEP